MHKIGQNRYFWPLLPDILWYEHDKIVCKIQEPSPVGSRHFQLSKTDYEHLLQLLPVNVTVIIWCVFLQR